MNRFDPVSKVTEEDITEKATYRIYSLKRDRLEFKTVYYGGKKRTARSDFKSEQGRSKQGFGN